MARLTGCCCCFSNLRDGVKAIGIVYLVLGSLYLLTEFIGVGIIGQEERELPGGQIVAIVLQFLFTILHLIFNSLLVHGVEKNNRGMLLAWLIFSGIVHGLQSLALVVFFIVVCVTGIFWFLLVVLAFAGLIGTFWYWFVVVLHCYLAMREESGFVYGKQENDGEGERHAL